MSDAVAASINELLAVISGRTAQFSAKCGGESGNRTKAAFHGDCLYLHGGIQQELAGMLDAKFGDKSQDGASGIFFEQAA